jgi:hypothetical protein
MRVIRARRAFDADADSTHAANADATQRLRHVASMRLIRARRAFDADDDSTHAANADDIHR